MVQVDAALDVALLDDLQGPSREVDRRTCQEERGRERVLALGKGEVPSAQERE
jgi:hypothetical protein